MTTDEAVTYARDDYAGIQAAASAGEQALIGATVERILLVDGSQYSPSWRAMRGGSIVHDEGDDLGDAAEAYAEELDALTNAYEGASALYWEEGCLFLGAIEEDE